MPFIKEKKLWRDSGEIGLESSKMTINSHYVVTITTTTTEQNDGSKKKVRRAALIGINENDKTEYFLANYKEMNIAKSKCINRAMEKLKYIAVEAGVAYKMLQNVDFQADKK
jgi:hypothetical protein